MTTTTFELQAEPRDGRGRTGSRQMRREGKVPAVVYGAGKESQSIAMDRNTLTREMNNPAFYTSILTVKIGADSQSVVVREVQRHPAKEQLMHLDFQRIVEDEELALHVPIHLLGEESAKGVKLQGGVVEQLATEVEIRSLPRHLPDFIEVDISELELNQLIHLSDLKLPEGVSLVALEHQQDLPVVTISPPRVQEVEEEETEEAEATAESEGGEGTAAQS